MASFLSILESDMFTITVGSEKKQYRVHTTALLASSKVFKRMIENGMAESITKTLHLEDIEQEDFARGIEYAYKGFYTAPRAEHRAAGPDELSTINSDGIQTYNLTARFTAMCGYCSDHRRSKPTFGPTCRVCNEAEHDRPEHDREFFTQIAIDSTQFGDSDNTERDVWGSKAVFDMTNVLLAHARLYVFAEKYDMAGLKEVILNNTAATLKLVHLRDDRCVTGLVQVLRLVFSDASTPDLGPGKEKMRSLVVKFAASRFQVLGITPAFVELLTEGGAFTRDMWLTLNKIIRSDTWEMY